MEIMSSVLILGATSDIAQAIAIKFAQEGYNLMLAGRDLSYLKRIHQDLKLKYDVIIQSYYFDAENYKEHDDFLQQIHEIPDIVILCFGYLGNQLLAEQDWLEAYRIIAANYVGAVSILNRIANLMETKRHGVIIGISSVAGDRGRRSNYIYGSAKAGLTAYLSGLRSRLYPYGVQVITVKPGYVKTRMTEGLNLPKMLTSSPEKAARKIYKGMIKKRNIIYIKGIWMIIMTFIRCIPEGLFKRIKF